MDYYALSIGVSNELFSDLRTRLSRCGLNFVVSTTTKEASRLLNDEIFHLLIVDLKYLRNIRQTDWLSSVRRISYVPVIILTETPELDMGSMIDIGMDICVSGKRSLSILCDMIYAQFRRYTEYNHYKDPRSTDAAPFGLGDIFIDPLRRIVEVRGQMVKLRPREFSLLLYFMQNPDVVLSSEKICEHAWNMTEGYDQGIAHPIYVLRQAIESNPVNPTHIQTVHRVGYRFIPNSVETCDKCESIVT